MIPRKLRIGVDGRPAVQDRTGIGTVTYQFLRRIQQVDSRNDYRFYFDRDPGTLAAELGPRCCAYGGPREAWLWANTYLPNRLACDDVDVFISFLDKDVPLFAPRTRRISMVHDVIPLRFPDVIFRNALHRLYYTKLLAAAIRRSDRILTNSEHSRVDISQAFPSAAPKLRKITFGFESPTVRKGDGLEILRRYGVHPPFFLALGSTEPRKNNSLVIGAFRRIAARYPRVSLVIGGMPWRGHEFGPDLRHSRVINTGFIADRDLPYFYANAELFVFVSLYEGFGLPVLEAMGHGTPVVASSCTAIPEVGADAVLYVQPDREEQIAAQIAAVMDSPDLAQTLAEKGRLRSRDFRWEVMCSQIVSNCRELCLP